MDTFEVLLVFAPNANGQSYVYSTCRVAIQGIYLCIVDVHNYKIVILEVQFVPCQSVALLNIKVNNQGPLDLTPCSSAKVTDS